MSGGVSVLRPSSTGLMITGKRKRFELEPASLKISGSLHHKQTSKRNSIDAGKDSEASSSSDEDGSQYGGSSDSEEDASDVTTVEEDSENEPSSYLTRPPSRSASSTSLKKAISSSSLRPKKYHCSYDGCTKAYSKPTRLAEHERSHTGVVSPSSFTHCLLSDLISTMCS